MIIRQRSNASALLVKPCDTNVRFSISTHKWTSFERLPKLDGIPPLSWFPSSHLQYPMQLEWCLKVVFSKVKLEPQRNCTTGGSDNTYNFCKLVKLHSEEGISPINALLDKYLQWNVVRFIWLRLVGNKTSPLQSMQIYQTANSLRNFTRKMIVPHVSMRSIRIEPKFNWLNLGANFSKHTVHGV